MRFRIARLVPIFNFFLVSGLLLAALPSQAQANTAAKGLLWEIKSASNTAYLFGSIHLAKADFYPLPASVEAAYLQADTLAVEIDATDSAASAKAMPMLSYRRPDNLKKHLSKATWTALQSVVGDAAEQFLVYKPAMVATGLAIGAFEKQGYDPAYGIDLHFLKRAKTDKKRVIELESIEFQARVLGGLSDKDGDALLKQTLDGFLSGDMQRDTDAMIETWKSGDTEALVKLMREAASKDVGSKKIMKLLLDDRNIGMAQQISSMLASGNKLFIVVGAGHIAGINSITDILQKQGLQVKQIHQ
ncbi:TraB/GumN family protein [Undibacterium sp. Ren11W]|uniref:TraB/GumN family protein n=1 Tax=Undibacterium sp. Ren11W TaxID=3413045 RepID=UPI003BF60B3D